VITQAEDSVSITVNGWTIYPHPALLEQMEALEAEVTRRGADSDAGKVFKWALQSVFEDIPRDPTNPYYRHGGMMGKNYTGWFRDKYAQRFRLFFRYNSDAKEIVAAWVNDEQSKRTRGAKNDVYAVFKKRLDSGNPPNAWAELREEAKAPGLVDRLKVMWERSRKG
jgi:toxin YhaV